MCFGGGPDVDTSYQDFAIREAERARQEETERQGMIDSGLAQIRAVFEGGTATAPGSYRDVTTTTPGTGRRPLTAAEQMQLDMAKKKARQSGGLLNQYWRDPRTSATPAVTTTSREYTPGKKKSFAGMQPILDQRREAMEGFYLPQIDKQYDSAREDLTFALHRAGLLNSTAAGEKQGDLSEMFSLERAGVLSDIERDISGTMGQLNQNRAAIEAALRSSGDASAATDAALSSMTAFRADSPTLQTLPSLFAGAATGIGAAGRGYDMGEMTGTRAKIPNPFAKGSGRVVGG